MIAFRLPLIASLLGLLVSGCSAYMAANQPGQKDLALIEVGQSRSKLIAELGAPLNSDTRNGQRIDVFKFTQGYHTGVKVGRAVLHGAADVATLGLWEIVGTPTEGYFNGTQISLEVTYDQNDRVARIVPLSGGEELQRMAEEKAMQVKADADQAKHVATQTRAERIAEVRDRE
jgi:hypothetical protein